MRACPRVARTDSHPGPGNVSRNLFVPVDANRTLAIYDYCFADAVSEPATDDFVRFIDQVQEEDVVLCESVQRGPLFGGPPGGKPRHRSSSNEEAGRTCTQPNCLLALVGSHYTCCSPSRENLVQQAE